MISFTLAMYLSSSATSALAPSGLMVDLLARPERTTLGNPSPRFSWVVNDTAENIRQEGFQILVASSPEHLSSDTGDVWDSGPADPGRKNANARSIGVPYGGPPLEPNATYHWKVRTWNGPGDVSPWSEPQTLHTGEWKGEPGTDCPPLVVQEDAAVLVEGKSRGHSFIDFGRVAFGTVAMVIDSPDARLVEVHLGEVVTDALTIDRDPGGARRYQMIPLEVKPGRHTYQVDIPSDERNTIEFAIHMPEDLFEVYPFRFVEVVNHPGELQRGDITRKTVHYPFDDQAAVFTSSNQVLNDVWKLCHYTMKATSFTGYYVDGDRERIPYEADAYINMLGHYACDREYAMARRTHEYLLETPTWPTEWILYSVLIAWKDYQFTGNPDSLRRHYETLKAKTLMALARDDGLITTTDISDEVLESIRFSGRSSDFFKRGIRDIVDWPPSERDEFDLRPVNAVVNAMHYEAVRLMAEIAVAIGADEEAESFRDRAERVRGSFREVFIDRHTGLVRDGAGSSHSSLHANMFALAFGLVPEANRTVVLEHIRSKGMACSVYGSQILLEALYAAHDDDHALKLLVSTGERSWAHMIYEVGSTITTEAWDNRLKPNQDWNHAWGAAPANIIPHFLMGVRPLSPGFERILIQPQPGDLARAELTTPTIRGPVTVRFDQSLSGVFHLETETPANTTTRVMLPVPKAGVRRATVDGRDRHPVEVDGFVVFEAVGSGRHSFSVSP